MNKPDDSVLPATDALRGGDEQAWRAFFESFDGVIRSVVAWPKWRFEAHTRDDVAQTIRLGIVQSIGRLQSDQSLQAFVRKICVNRCIDALRRQIREQNRLEPLGYFNEDGEWVDRDFSAGAEFDPVVALQQIEQAAALRETLAKLDEQSQTLILQFYVEGLSYRELAERHGVAVNTVGSRLSRCLDRLGKLLARTEAERPAAGERG